MATEVRVTFDDDEHEDLKDDKDEQGITWKDAIRRGVKGT